MSVLNQCFLENAVGSDGQQLPYWRAEAAVDRCSRLMGYVVRVRGDKATFPGIVFPNRSLLLSGGSRGCAIRSDNEQRRCNARKSGRFGAASRPSPAPRRAGRGAPAPPAPRMPGAAGRHRRGAAGTAGPGRAGESRRRPEPGGDPPPPDRRAYRSGGARRRWARKRGGGGGS